MQSLPFLPLPAAAADARRFVQSVTVEQIRSMQHFLLGDTSQVKIPMDDAFDVNGDGCVDVFDIALLKRSFSQQQETSGDFYSLSSELVLEHDVQDGSVIMTDDFYSKRVIVKTDADRDFQSFSPVSIISGPDHIYVLQFDSVEKAEICMASLRGTEGIQYVELDAYMKSDEPQDVEASDANSWGVAEIEADQYAAYLSEHYDASVVVAVVDTGVSAHTFLGDRLLSNGYDLVDNDTDPSDMHYHGTHVAGTVVDCTPGLPVQIMPVRVLDGNGRGSNLNVGNGIRYAVEHGANVINLSLSGKGCSRYIDDAVNYAVSHGATVVAAAGNHSSNTVYYCPAHIENCIVVGACDSDRAPATFTNTGNSVDVIAPGVNIKSCIPGGGFKNLNGTSMATPHIAAAAAMIKIARPQASPAEIEALLKKISLDLGEPGKDPVFGCGIPKLSELIVNVPDVKHTITLSETQATIWLGDQFTLEATTSPKAQTVLWNTSDDTVATVKDGVITAVGAGTADITASIPYDETSIDAVCKVTVMDDSDKILESGQCGDDAYYTLDGNGLLTVTGTGKTWEYASSYARIVNADGSDVPHSPLYENDQVKKIRIEEGITELQAGLFSKCTSLKEVSFAGTVTTLCTALFAGCTGLESIYIPANIEKIGYTKQSYEVFWDCTSLKEIRVDADNAVYADDDGVLISKDGTRLCYIPLAKGDYVIKDGITTLDEGCAYANPAVTELILPQSVTEINPYAIYKCENLKDLQLGSGVRFIGRFAFGKTALTSVTIPSSVTTIESFAFGNCPIESAVFAPYGTEGLTMNSDAFNGSNLTSLALPDRTEKIKKGILSCDVSNVTLPCQTVEIADAAFSEKNTLHGYRGSDVETYADAHGIPFVGLETD